MQFFRRSMLQVMVSGALCSALPSIAFAQTQKLAPEYDVIVIGSGFAGLAAAISAAENGAKVVVLEKMQVAGGNSSRSGGMMAIPGSSVQKEQGIEDSPEAMLKDLLKAGKGFCHPELTKTLVGNGVEAFDFIVKHGAKFKDTVMMPGGMTAKRLLQPDYNGATGLLAPLRESYLRWAASSSCAARSTGCCSIVTDGSKALRRVRITISIRGSNRTISRTRAGRPCATGRNGA